MAWFLFLCEKIIKKNKATTKVTRKNEKEIAKEFEFENEISTCSLHVEEVNISLLRCFRKKQASDQIYQNRTEQDS